eukprot:TRINITY_DN1762_c0_g1_i1.p1 TRINITY_DN1762_c0_g1~~TRINITY_DN1762_c0_g1_i1.p1  ORF type:complete len:323 (-),score=50.25 TRINITY_DN1762_c0_g1_i1:31-873(-)
MDTTSSPITTTHNPSNNNNIKIDNHNNQCPVCPSPESNPTTNNNNNVGKCFSTGRGLMEILHDPRRWIIDQYYLEVPSVVRPERRLLTLEIAYYLLSNNIEGDFVETGVYTGGTSILLVKSLQKWDTSGKRLLWAADSFEGLPAPGQNDKSAWGTIQKGAFSASLEVFKNNMIEFKTWDETKVKILQGWFKDSLPAAPINKISYLRLDGDFYDSTRQPLDLLYSKVTKGGIVYVDDYGSYEGCRRAVDEFRAEHGITSPLIPQRIPDPTEGFEAVYWYVE